MQSDEKLKENLSKKKYQLKTHLNARSSMKANTNPSFTQSLKHLDQIGFSSSVLGKEAVD